MLTTASVDVRLLGVFTVTTDLERFEREGAAALTAGDSAACAGLADRYPGADLLPAARYEAWTEQPRRRATRLWLELLRSGRRWERLAEADPTDEEAQQQV